MPSGPVLNLTPATARALKKFMDSKTDGFDKTKEVFGLDDTLKLLRLHQRLDEFVVKLDGTEEAE